MQVSERKKANEAKISGLALKAFKAKGIENTSIRDIMRDSDMALGSFYSYFNDKKDLEEKLVLKLMADILYKADKQCQGLSPTDRYISFLAYIIDYLVDNPVELNLIIRNVNWALYAKVENEERFKDADTALRFILSKYAELFTVDLSESEQLYVLSLSMNIVLSTCKYALMDEMVLSLDEMKAVLYEIVEKIFR